MSSPNNTEHTHSSDYKSVTASAPTLVTKKTVTTKDGPKPGWLKRKYIKIKGALAEFWVVGRYGFQLGGAAGLMLGFLVGGFESIRMKSFWPLPLAMIGSGFTFGCIFAISTMLRTQEEGKYAYSRQMQYEMVFYDKESGKYVRKTIPTFPSYTNGNNRI
jgi:hypothetical protein